MNPSYFENINAACAARGYTLTEVLRSVGKATSSVTSWRKGSMPAIDSCDLIAQKLGISIDELVRGSSAALLPRKQKAEPEPDPYAGLSKGEAEWLRLYARIPEGQRYAYKQFILRLAPDPELSEEMIGTA